MPAMGGMAMSGGSMSVWTRMPGQTWPGAAASFLGVWIVMMMAMMTPSLVPTLWRYRRAVRLARTTGEMRLARLTGLVGMGYFFVWTVVGMVVFALGIAAAGIEMPESAHRRIVPIAIGLVLLIAALLQQTAWKARQLALCREVPARGRALRADVGAAWRFGVCLGLHCCRSCAGLTAVALALGIMDLRVMIVVTAAITAERLAPAGERVARFVGVVAAVAGMFLIATGGVAH